MAYVDSDALLFEQMNGTNISGFAAAKSLGQLMGSSGTLLSLQATVIFGIKRAANDERLNEFLV